MTRVLVLSSQVACGHVGLSAAAPALHALGHTVLGLPTVMLSNHPGFPHVGGAKVPVAQLQDMLDALDGNGWLADVDAVLTGYLPTVDHVIFAAGMIARLRRADGHGPAVIVDPVLGDSPQGLYIDEAAARALRDTLVPMADVLTPNRSELDWLGDVASVPRLIVTSSGRKAGETGVTEITGARTRHFAVAERRGVPHGTGDVFAALIAAGLTTAAALGHLQALIEDSLGAPHLKIAEAARSWTCAAPWESSDGL